MCITAILRTDLDGEIDEKEVYANFYTTTHYGKKIYSVGRYYFSGYYDSERNMVIIDGNEICDGIDNDY